MKKIINKSIFLLSFLFVLGACEKKELIELNPDANSELSLSESVLVLIEDNEDQDILTANWTEPEFGFNAAPTYRILIDFANGDFSEAQSIAVGDVYTTTLNVGQLNSKLINLGAVPDIPTDFDIRVLTVLSDFSTILSEPQTITITPYYVCLDLSTTWGIVGSATPNGWDGPDLIFLQTGTNNVYKAFVELTTGHMKFRENNSWDLNYGDTGNDGSLEEGGSDIPVDEGTYKIQLNLSNLTYTKEIYVLGIVGSATPNEWNGPDLVLPYDTCSDTFKAVVTLTDGEIKFRLNNEWNPPIGFNYGDNGADGTLEEGGANIAVTAGTYVVSVNLSDLDNPIYSIQ